MRPEQLQITVDGLYDSAKALDLRVLDSSDTPSSDTPSADATTLTGASDAAPVPRVVTMEDVRRVELHEAHADVIAGIRDTAHLDAAEARALIGGYQAAAKESAQLKVCGACGVRGPDVSYSDEKVYLNELADDHWLVVPDAAVEQFDPHASVELIVRCEGDFREMDFSVSVSRRAFYNLYDKTDENGRTRWYHVQDEVRHPALRMATPLYT